MADKPSPSPMTFKVKDVERRQIVADAKEAGLTVSSYIRSRLFEVPQTKPVYQKTETRLLIKHMIGQIGRVGNNMNQIAWKLNSDQMLRSVDREELQEGIRVLKDMRALLITHLLQRGPAC